MAEKSKAIRGERVNFGNQSVQSYLINLKASGWRLDEHYMSIEPDFKNARLRKDGTVIFNRKELGYLAFASNGLKGFSDNLHFNHLRNDEGYNFYVPLEIASFTGM